MECSAAKMQPCSASACALLGWVVAQLQDRWELRLTVLGCVPWGCGVRVQLRSSQIPYHLKMICNSCICLSLTARDEPL